MPYSMSLHIKESETIANGHVMSYVLTCTSKANLPVMHATTVIFRKAGFDS